MRGGGARGRRLFRPIHRVTYPAIGSLPEGKNETFFKTLKPNKNFPSNARDIARASGLDPEGNEPRPL